jgi:hypothetical protein
MLALYFITLRMKDTGKNVRNINPFYIQKALDSIAQNVKDASHLKNGRLLVEVQNDRQVEVLGKAKSPWILSCPSRGIPIAELLQGDY